LRWRRRDGERRVAWIKPIIDHTGERPRLDHFAMAREFLNLMRADASSPPGLPSRSAPDAASSPS
jgi:hypothetical protein